MATNCTLFADRQHYCTVIYAVKQTICSLELIGSIFIIFIIWLFKKYKYFDQRLILALGIAALGESICLMLTDVPQQRGHFCRFQAWLVTYFVLAVLAWVCCITFNIWKALRGDRAKRLEKYYHIISWSVPFVVACLPLIGDSYGPAGPWCWVAGDVEYSAIWRFATYYIPLFLCIIAILVANIYIFVKYRQRAKRWEGVHGRNNTAEDEQRKRVMNSLLAYPCIYLVLSLGPLAYRIHNAVSPKPSFVLILVHVISIPLTGLANAIAFGLNKDTLRRLNWADLKAAFQQHLPLKANAKAASPMGVHKLGEPTCTVIDIHQDANVNAFQYGNQAMVESSQNGFQLSVESN
ncbi:cyclic AMP receptor-like protein A [Montipora foliosa]|uniref:cyclic AMP receptor-like protein A n=1 Tax=Montipora foliosa TaxID=591990 RepID=UPI0035F15B08